MAYVNNGSQFYLLHTGLFFIPRPQSIITLWMVLTSCPNEGTRLSWPGSSDMPGPSMACYRLTTKLWNSREADAAPSESFSR